MRYKKGSPFHILSWASHRSRLPAKSTSAAEMLAASEAVEETVILKEVMSSIIVISRTGSLATKKWRNM